MKELLLQILIFAYAGVGVAAIIGYIPTIIDVSIRKKKNANIGSYVIWTITSGISFLYSLFILPDLLFRVVSAFNLIGCGLVLLFSLILRYTTKD